MRALAAVEKGVFDWVEVTAPTPGPYDALVKMEVCGICNSTDWKLASADVGWAAPPPLLLGHESVGTVVAVGERVTKFRIGDRVTRAYAATEGTVLCGYHVFMGGFAEYGLVSDGPAKVAAGLLAPGNYTADRQNVAPAGLSALDAALAISLAETASFVHSIGSYDRRRVLIAGTGIAGLTMALWAKLAGALRVVVLGRREERLALARALGADDGVNIREADDAAVLAALGGPADIFMDAVGEPSFSARAGNWLAPNGLFAAYGLLPKDTAYSALPAGIQPAAAVVNEHEKYYWVADLLQRGIIRAEMFRSHVWNMDEAAAGFAAAHHGDVLKGFVVFP